MSLILLVTFSVFIVTTCVCVAYTWEDEEDEER